MSEGLEDMVRWSAVMATKNSGPFVAEAISSVLNQSMPPSEIIIVDDNSTDTTREVLIHHSRTYSNIKLVFLDEDSGGAARPRNVAISKMTSPFGVIFDDDDISDSKRASKQIQQLLEGVHFSYAGSQIVDIDSNDIELHSYEFDLTVEHFHEMKAQLLFGIRQKSKQFIAVPSAVMAFQKSAFEALGCFDETLRRCEDIDLALKAVSERFHVRGMSEILVTRRRITRQYKSKVSDVVYERQLQERYMVDYSKRFQIGAYLHFKARLHYAQRKYFLAVLYGCLLGFIVPHILAGSVLRLLKLKEGVLMTKGL
jgi:glycosyltransferase involved in cell wall biosynthesis